jgi:hypothetical protein
MTNHPTTAPIRSLILKPAQLKAAELIMVDASQIVMPICGNAADLWMAIESFPVPPGCKSAIIGGILWLSDGSWIERSYNSSKLGWVLRLCPTIPADLQERDRLCACGCERKLSKGNRSGYASACHTKAPDVRKRLADNRRTARARARSTLDKKRTIE